MFFSMGHGKRVIRAGDALPDNVAARAAIDVTGARDTQADQTFGYLFTDDAAPEFPETVDIDAKLEALAVAMQEPVPEADELNGILPPIFTYLGQFIDHDISVNTDRDTEASKIAEEPLARQPRGVIEANVQNGRRGSLALDSLYGDVPNPTDQSAALQAAMRDGPFLREGMTAPIGGTRPVLPRTGGDDLPRIGTLIDDNVLDPAILPDAIRPNPNNPNDDRRALAFIGDGRNDENLIVAQLHLAFIRFHNTIARQIIADARGPISDDRVFALARQSVIWTYQWLVVNEFLPAICRRQDVDAVIQNGAPLYTAFFERLAAGNLAGLLPLPLEFSAAAYRYGHTMVRQNYDFNLNFGRPAFDQDGPRRASLTQMFQFTGRSVDGTDPFGPAPGHVLPQNWVIEWNRLIESRPRFSDRLARSIDTRLAPDLFNMVKEEAGVFKNLALRNLRRGYNMNLPSGQAVLRAMRSAGIPLGPTLNKTRLTAGLTGRALRGAGLADDTPLWFYVLKEAEEMENGARLGTVGSNLVADAIFGLLLHDNGSYWHAPGTGPGGRWHPADGVKPGGVPVAGLDAFLTAAGVLESAAIAPSRVSSPRRGMTLRAPAAAPTGVDTAEVEDAVFDRFEATFGRINRRYSSMAPSDRDMYDGNDRAWKLDFQNGVNAPLVTDYPTWNDGLGMSQAALGRLFNENFNNIYRVVVESILEDIVNS